MPFPEVELWSPNQARSPRHECRGVVVHHTSCGWEAALQRLVDPASEVSYHVLIREDGARWSLVPDEAIAWHAGASHFRGRSRCNDFLLGLGWVGNTYERPLTDAQLASALEWLEPRRLRYGWSVEDVTDHRQIAPGRKDDLNPPEWER